MEFEFSEEVEKMQQNIYKEIEKMITAVPLAVIWGAFLAICAELTVAIEMPFEGMTIMLREAYEHYSKEKIKVINEIINEKRKENGQTNQENPKA